MAQQLARITAEQDHSDDAFSWKHWIFNAKIHSSWIIDTKLCTVYCTSLAGRNASHFNVGAEGGYDRRGRSVDG